jgi:hypothetical protein
LQIVHEYQQFWQFWQGVHQGGVVAKRFSRYDPMVLFCLDVEEADLAVFATTSGFAVSRT